MRRVTTVVCLVMLGLSLLVVPVQAAERPSASGPKLSALADAQLRQAIAGARSHEPLDLIVPEAATASLAALGVEIGSRVGTLPFYTARATRDDVAQATRAGLTRGMSLNQVVRAVRPAEVPDWMRPLLMNASELTGALRLHADGLKGQGTSVAVIDSGIQASHPYFRDAAGRSRVVAESCFVSLQIFTNPELPCPGNQSSVIGPGAADIGSDKRFGHGTHVAGVAAGNAAEAPGASGYTGMAPEATLVVSRVFGTGGAADSDITAALDWVASLAPTHNIAAVNLSLGFFQSRYFDCRSLMDSIYGAVSAKTRAAGVAIVASAGNEGSLMSISAPACAEGWVSVGATDSLSRVAAFSNVGEELDIMAPGVNIWSAVPGDTFEAWSGTSMASPVVAGAFALLRGADPTATVAAGLAAMRSTGPRINDVIVKDLPTLRVDMALSQLQDRPDVGPVAPSPPLNVSVQPMDRAVRITWGAPSSDGGSAINGYIANVMPAGSFCAPSGETSCVIGGLTNGTAYRASVYARNAYGVSAPVLTEEFRPTQDVPVPPRPKPGAVTDLTAQSLTGAIRVSWRAPQLVAGQGPVSYEYRVGRSIPKPTQMLSVRVEGKKGIPIKVGVRPVSKGGPGPWLSVTSTPG